MSQKDLNELLDAEKTAQQRIEAAKHQADRIIKEAERKGRAEQESRMSSMREKRESVMEKEKRSAEEEASKIRRDGIQIAKGLSSKAEQRIPMAVDKVLELLFDKEGEQTLGR